MEYYIVIDCGTTNSRAYVTDAGGTIYATEKKHVGVRDTSITGNRDVLAAGLRQIIEKAVSKAGISENHLVAILSSGMITSEIGLCEIPHLVAPGGIRELAENMVKVDDLDLFHGLPVYFVRGIRNAVPPGECRPTQKVGALDVTRGEETQICGLLARPDCKLPAVAVVLSSHTKFLLIDADGVIQGSLTTISGQLFAALREATFLGKSVEPRDDADSQADDFFDEAIVRDAIEAVHKAGLSRSLMYPRFMDVILDTKWQERFLYLQSLIAADDTLCLGQIPVLFGQLPQRVYLIGTPGRCRLYRFVLEETWRDSRPEIRCITEPEEIDELSIRGILAIARRAGLLDG